MAKSKNIFFCQECGYESAKWLGQCPACKAWNTFVDQPLERGVRLPAVLDIRLKLPNRCCCHRFIQVMRSADQREFRNLTESLVAVLCRDPLC